jgi:hypothetical protein
MTSSSAVTLEQTDAREVRFETSASGSVHSGFGGLSTLALQEALNRLQRQSLAIARAYEPSLFLSVQPRALDVAAILSFLTSQVADPPELLQAEWRRAVETEIDGLASLPPNWDTYGAPVIEPSIIADARQLVVWIAAPGAPAPSVVPTVHGGVQLEWHTLKCDAELQILQPNLYHVFVHAEGVEPWEGETTRNEAVEKLHKGLFR